MRPENEWFKPEQLTAYYYLYEAVAFVLLAVGAGVLVSLGAFADAPSWVLALLVVPTLAAFAFLTWWIPAFYRSADYRLTDEEVEYRRGVFFRGKTTVPYNRITNVDATQGPVQRFVDCGSVGIHTAGYGGQMGAELTITGISDYEAVKDQVLAKVRHRRPMATEGEDDTDADLADFLAGDGQTDAAAMLAEIRRIRELLERGGTV
jgi:membrane protein YdbS with pleckstrin-like domain